MRCQISREEALMRLRQKIESMSEEDLNEVCGELLIDTESGSASADAMRDEIRDRFDKGLVDEELEDTWNVVFPEHRRVHFDEDAQKMTYVAP